MKICWDNLEGLRYSKKTGYWYGPYNEKWVATRYEYRDACKYCGDPYLSQTHSNGGFCSASCRTKAWNPILIKGRKHSNETKEKWRLAGRHIGKQNPNYGAKTFTSKTIKKMKDAKKGLFDGEKNPNWRGGIAYLPYCSAWTKPFKIEIKDRDNNECQNPLCEHLDAPLCVHHIDYHRGNCDPENLISLCMVCNSKANKDRRWHEAYYTAIMDKNKQQRIIKTRRAYHE